jgi:hypothetical protein
MEGGFTVITIASFSAEPLPGGADDEPALCPGRSAFVPGLERMKSHRGVGAFTPPPKISKPPKLDGVLDRRVLEEPLLDAA